MKRSMNLYQKLSDSRSSCAAFDFVLRRIVQICGEGAPPSAIGTDDPDLFAMKYLSHELRRKEARPFGVVVDLEQIKRGTLFHWRVRERVNRHINRTLTWGFDSSRECYDSDLLGDKLLHRARDLVAEIVGTCDITECIRASTFGNGASATLSRAQAQREKKYLHTVSVTRNLLPYVAELMCEGSVWGDLVCPKDTLYVDSAGKHRLPPDYLKIVSGAVLDQVPKTAKVNRIIMKEPELNGYVQKGTGKVLRRRLRSYTGGTPEGVNLNTSGDLNRWLAQAGSLHGHISTVDAERASDSLTIALYELLWPSDWFEWFMTCRSPYVMYDDGSNDPEYHKLGMMSGMGNGFTFEAESIMFYAIGLACAEQSKLPNASIYVSVHGDDLTVPSDCIDLVFAAYKAAGVAINQEKTYSSGPFRESCGGHFVCGHSVKPFYCKTSNGSQRGDWFWLANSLSRWLLERSDSFLSSGKGKALRELRLAVSAFASNNSKVWAVPCDRGLRSGLHSNPNSSIGPWKVRNIVDVPRKDMLPELGRYLAWLQSPQVTCILDFFFAKEEVRSYEATTSVDERERWSRVYAWPLFHSGRLDPFLWDPDAGYESPVG